MNSRIGLGQVCSQDNLAENQEYARSLLEIAHDKGLDLVAFPEMFLLISSDKRKKFEVAQTLDGSLIHTFQEYAQKYRISVLLGSFYEYIPEDPTKLYNTSVLLNRDGEIQGVYRKIHLCDIDSPALHNLESADIKAGTQPIVVEHELGKVGLTICYDLRFPGLYQHLRSMGAEIIFAPAAANVHVISHGDNNRKRFSIKSFTSSGCGCANIESELKFNCSPNSLLAQSCTFFNVFNWISLNSLPLGCATTA